MDNTKTKKSLGTKRFKTVGGFVETNADDDEETKLVTEKLKKKQMKQEKKLKSKLIPSSTNEEDAPKIKVHNVATSKNNDTDSNSNSEDDSYIDQFFNDGDDCDENHIYSLDEIETKQENGFLSMASGDESILVSDDSMDSPPEKKTKKTKKHQSKESSDSEHSSPKNKLVSYKKNSADQGEYDFDEYMWSGGDDEEVYTESDYDDSDDMYGLDSEISLGSEVDSDDTYECESTDDESMGEYEDDMSYDEYDEHTSDSECDHSGSVSEYSSGDTYDDFVNSRRYGDDNSSDDDHEYMSKLFCFFLFFNQSNFFQSTFSNKERHRKL